VPAADVLTSLSGVTLAATEREQAGRLLDLLVDGLVPVAAGGEAPPGVQFRSGRAAPSSRSNGRASAGTATEGPNGPPSRSAKRSANSSAARTRPGTSPDRCGGALSR